MGDARGPVLIVDSVAEARALMGELVRGEGYSVLEAESAEAALELAGEQEPSLVVLDVVLPGMTGYELCRQLRARFGEELPIMFVSAARTDPHDRVAGLLLGADDYVARPFLPDELLARIRRLLVRSGRERRASPTGVLGRLTKREHEILTLLAGGMAQRAIAAELYISPKTVATHIQRLLVKLGAHSRAEAVAVAYREGILPRDAATADDVA